MWRLSGGENGVIKEFCYNFPSNLSTTGCVNFTHGPTQMANAIVPQPRTFVSDVPNGLPKKMIHKITAIKRIEQSTIIFQKLKSLLDFVERAFAVISVGSIHALLHTSIDTPIAVMIQLAAISRI